jgi:cytochrome c oxidase subunit II
MKGRNPLLHDACLWFTQWVVVLTAGCAGNQSMFNPEGPAARRIADLGSLLIGICLFVYVVVLAVAAWSFLRPRHASDDSDQTTARLGTIVVAAVAVTAAILVTLTGLSAAAGRGLTSPASQDAITVDVIGHQWWWDFQYRGDTPQEFVTTPNELHVPIGVPVVLRAQSRDVIHSFWVPNLQGKRDLIPGQITITWLQADRAGIYRGQCAEFCGHQHAKMAFTVVAEPRDAFQRWLQRQRQAATDPTGEPERHGREVFLRSTCVTCHTIRGTDAGSHVGPELTHVGSRRTIAAGTLPNSLEHLRMWVANPPSIKPGTRMPPHGLSADDFEAVIAYLRSLQ